jgi:hypothetical protein
MDDWYLAHTHKMMAGIFSDHGHAVCFTCQPTNPETTMWGLQSQDAKYDSYTITDYNSLIFDAPNKQQMRLMAEYIFLVSLIMPQVRGDKVIDCQDFHLKISVINKFEAGTLFKHRDGEGCVWDNLYR